MTEIQNNLAMNLRKYRLEQGLTQEKLAEKIDTATNYISMIERCRKFPSPEMIEKLALALKVDSGSLFIGKRTLGERLDKLQSQLQYHLDEVFSGEHRFGDSQK